MFDGPVQGAPGTRTGGALSSQAGGTGVGVGAGVGVGVGTGVGVGVGAGDAVALGDVLGVCEAAATVGEGAGADAPWLLKPHTRRADPSTVISKPRTRILPEASNVVSVTSRSARWARAAKKTAFWRCNAMMGRLPYS